jgi:hypothetical protein
MLVVRYWSAFLFSFSAPNSVIPPLKKYNKLLELLDNVVTQDKDIIDLVI